MVITKRNGRQVKFNPNNIQKRLRIASEDLKVDPDKVFKECISSIQDGDTTKEVDESLARACHSMITSHPDYGTLGARILLSRLYKEVEEKDYLERQEDRLNENTISNILNWKIPYDKYKDLDINSRGFLAARAFIDEYCMKGETPLELYSRVCAFLYDTKQGYLRGVDKLMNKKMSLASPQLLNAGTLSSNMISCTSLSLTDDSTEGILKLVSSATHHSRGGSGLGIYIGDLRSRYSNFGKGKGKASGIVKLCRVLEPFSVFFRQHEKRRGAFVVTNNIWHMEILDFINMKDPSRQDNMSAKDMFYAVAIPNEFYKRIIKNEDWYLFCPSDEKKILGKYLSDFVDKKWVEAYNQMINSEVKRITIKAKQLMTQLSQAFVSSGVPYVYNRDNGNKNHNHRHLGVMKSQQLCVTGDTKVLTDRGHIPIEELVGQEVMVWNGSEFTNTVPFLAEESSIIYEVEFNDTTIVKTNDIHKWFLHERGKTKEKVVRTKDLKIGDKVVKNYLPTVLRGDEVFPNAYANGLYSADGNEYKDEKFITLYDKKQDLIERFTNSIRKRKSGKEGLYITKLGNKTKIALKTDGINKYTVPSTKYTYRSFINWLEGYFDGDACILTSESGSKQLQVVSINKSFLETVRTELQCLGIDSRTRLHRPEGSYPLLDSNKEIKNYDCKEAYMLSISNNNLLKLVEELGFSPSRLDIKGLKKAGYKSDPNYIKITNIKILEEKEPTYCLRESKRNKFMANGIITGNCNEFLAFHEEGEEAQCDLGSIVVCNHIKNGEIDWKDLKETIGEITYILNSVIDKNSWNTKQAEITGNKQRAIGIGIAGLSDLAMELNLAFDSEKFMNIQRKVQEYIYYYSIYFSNLYKTQGLFKDTEVIRNSPLVKEGIFRFGKEVPKNSTLDWNKLREDVMIGGVCNSLFVCNMPTSGTSKLLECVESFEAMQEPIIKRKIVSGEYTVANKYVYKALEENGMLNNEVINQIITTGSVQMLNLPNGEVFKNVWELGSKNTVEMAIKRKDFVDMGESMNLYYEDPTATEITKNLILGAKGGLTSGVYYTKPKKKTKTNSDLGKITKEKPNDSNFECFGCST